MSRAFDRGRWAAPVVLLLLATAVARPAAATPAPACLTVTAAVPTASTAAGCYKEMIGYVNAAGQFFAAYDAYNHAVDYGTAADVQEAGDQLDDASNAMVWAGIQLVVCLVQLM